MEQSAEVVDKHQKSERLPLSKSSGQLIRIGSIYIDIASAMDNQQDTSQCEHMSIREYVAEMRKKNITVCLPFPTDDKQIESVEKTSYIFPPMGVVKYKWWSCHNCLREIAVACCAQEDAKVPDSSDAKGKNISGNMDLDEPSFGGHISSKNTPLESNRSSSVDVGQNVIPNSPKSLQRIDIQDCETIPKVGTAGVEDINGNKGRTNISHSLNDLSSDSSNGLANDDHHDELMGSLSKSIRQRATKVRLLTDILGSSGNVENNQNRITDSDFHSASDFGDGMSVQENPKQQPKGKRKITQSENKKPHLVPKKPQLSESNSDYFAEKNCMVVSDTEESSDTFSKQKNLEEHVSSNKKQKQTEHEGVRPILMPRPDVAKKYHFAATQEGFPRPGHHLFRNTEMDPYYKSSPSPLQAEQKSNISKTKNNVPVPPWGTMLGEDSFVRRNTDNYMRKGVDFSLKSYSDVMQRNRESHISKAKTGVEPSFLSWNSAVRERFHQVKDAISHHGESSNFRKAAPDLDSGKGYQYDLDEKITSQSPIRDMQNVMPQFGKGTIPHHRDLNMPGSRNRKPRNDDQDKGNDNFPMEVLELMAKNQYERRRHEFEMNNLSERTNENRNFESMGFSTARGNGLLKFYQVEVHNVRNLISQKTTVNPSEYLASMKMKPNNSLNINENRLNMRFTEGGKSAFTRCSSVSNNQGTQSGRVSYPGYGSGGNGNYQNIQWRNDRIGTSFSPPEARYSPFPNYTNIPQKCAPQASYFGTNSQIPEGLSRGKMATGLDLNLMNEKYNNLGNQNKGNGIESLRKSSDFVSIALKHKGNDFHSKLPGSVDLNSDETIAAILLSLSSDPNLNSDVNRKMVSKPVSSCDYQPKVLDKPIIISDNDPKKAFGRDIRVSSNSSRPSASTSYVKNQWRDNSYVRPPPLPDFGPFSSSFHSNKSNSNEGKEITTRIPSKIEEKKKGPAQDNGLKLIIEEKKKGPVQNSGRKLQKKPEYITNVLKNNNVSNSVQINEGGNQLSSRTEFCRVNRNPADFSSPEPGNLYMIRLTPTRTHPQSQW